MPYRFSNSIQRSGETYWPLDAAYMCAFATRLRDLKWPIGEFEATIGRLLGERVGRRYLPKKLRVLLLMANCSENI